jgi:hypothetical protein
VQSKLSSSLHQPTRIRKQEVEIYANQACSCSDEEAGFITYLPGSLSEWILSMLLTFLLAVWALWIFSGLQMPTWHPLIELHNAVLVTVFLG